MKNYDQIKINIQEKAGVTFALIAGIFLCIASVVMFANIVTRTAADINIKIVYELAQLCGAGVASFAIPYATIKSSHTEMDIITSHLKPRTRAMLGGVSGIITMIVMLFTVYMLVSYAYQRTLTLETTTTNHLPLYLFRWTYAGGMFITMIAAASEMVDNFRIVLGKKVLRNKEELDGPDARDAGKIGKGGEEK